ncbi:hypothetical protein L2E82_24943 [Cichorium intybus]|uniref:Uncharacterized protein n=1 Tax=Cichorium intybus TaxID=13427 RepID=A0ACB9E2A5_CICIN|nr:hypothetical protein L2E82_24943 [Cichorium intybus]
MGSSESTLSSSRVVDPKVLLELFSMCQEWQENRLTTPIWRKDPTGTSYNLLLMLRLSLNERRRLEALYIRYP